jgi:hypothetical protein
MATIPVGRAIPPVIAVNDGKPFLFLSLPKVLRLLVHEQVPVTTVKTSLRIYGFFREELQLRRHPAFHFRFDHRYVLSDPRGSDRDL